MTKTEFFIASGSVIGYEHRRTGRNNQDGFFAADDGNIMAAIVTDGCSSSTKSEVGAQLVAGFVSAEIIRFMKKDCFFAGSQIIELLEKATLDFLRETATRFSNPAIAIDEMFLTTIVGIIMNEFFTTVFTAGDGVILLNGEVMAIDEENTPFYLGYRAYPGSYEVREEKIKMVVRHELPTAEVKNIIIATDGLKDLIAKADQTLNILGREEKVGGIEQFLDSRYLKNPSLLQRRLFQLNKERITVDWEREEVRRSEGILNDDTTIFLIRRR